VALEAGCVNEKNRVALDTLHIDTKVVNMRYPVQLITT